MIAYHYCVTEAWRLIEKDGVLRRSERYTRSTLEPEAVWLTVSEDPEPTCIRGDDGVALQLLPAILEQIEHTKLIEWSGIDPDTLVITGVRWEGLLPSVLDVALTDGWVRIGVDADAWPLHTFREWYDTVAWHPVADYQAHVMWNTARDRGSDPNRDWRLSYEDIPRDAWACVEFFDWSGEDWPPPDDWRPLLEKRLRGRGWELVPAEE